MTDDATPDLSAPLLRYLQRTLGRPDLEYLSPPAHLAVGTEAWLLGFSLRGAPWGSSTPLVLRALHHPEELQIVLEHAVQNAVADQGFPAPRVFASSDAGEELGLPFLIMEFRPGRPRPELPNAIELQMQILAQLHDLDPEPVARSLATHRVPAASATGSSRVALATVQVERWSMHQYLPLLEWLQMHVPTSAARSICHGDPHLYNMLMDEAAITAVIDWGTARLNVPEMDVGLLCGYARCGDHPASAGSDPRQLAVDRLIEAYERFRPLDHDRLVYFEMDFLMSVLIDMTDRYLRRAAGESLPANPLLDHAATTELVCSRIGQVLTREIPTPEQIAAQL